MSRGVATPGAKPAARAVKPRAARAPDGAGRPGPDRIDDYLFYWVGHLDNLYQRAIGEALRPLRLDLAVWRTLHVLMRGDGITVSRLAEITVIERTALSRVIDRMAKRGLVRRQTGAADRRVVEVHLNPAGRALHAQILPAVHAAYARAIGAAPDAEIRALIARLRTLCDNLAGGYRPF